MCVRVPREQPSVRLARVLTGGRWLCAQMLCVTNLPPCLFDHTPPGVFDGQGSGHDFYGTMWNPPSGFVSGMDGDRAGHFNCDYRQVLPRVCVCMWRSVCSRNILRMGPGMPCPVGVGLGGGGCSRWRVCNARWLCSLCVATGGRLGGRAREG